MDSKDKEETTKKDFDNEETFKSGWENKLKNWKYNNNQSDWIKKQKISKRKT